MSMTSSLHHCVINTYRRKMTIFPEHEEDLYRFIWKFIQEKNCKLLRIGGIENHIHIFIDLHPKVALADLLAELKRRSSLWMKQSGYFPYFEGWGREYFGFSKSIKEKDAVIRYIMSQKEHHKGMSFESEIKGMVESNGMAWDDILLT